MARRLISRPARKLFSGSKPSNLYVRGVMAEGGQPYLQQNHRSNILAMVARLRRRFANKLQSMVLAMQVSRLIGVLNGFSDHQLANLGIQRHDIPQHAERLVCEAKSQRRKTKTE